MSPLPLLSTWAHPGAWWLLVHVAATWFMVGVIWFVQLVQYPLFAEVAPASFIPFHAAHVRRITWVVAPAMLVEATAGVALLFTPGVSRGLAGLSALLLLVVWGSTALLQVPLHNALARGFDRLAWRRLVSSNRLRTAAWSARGVLAIAMMMAT